MYSRLIGKGLIRRSFTISDSKIRFNSSLCNRRLANSQYFNRLLTNQASNITRHLSTSINLLNSDRSDQIDLNKSNEFIVGQTTDRNEIDISNLDSIEKVTDSLLESANQTVQNVNHLSNVVTATDIGLTPFLLPRFFFDMITILHNHTTFSWVASIGVSCLILRCLTFPLYLESKRSAVAVAEKMIKMQISVANVDLKGSSSTADAKQKQAEALKSMEDYRNFVPKAMISPLTQAVVFSSFYFCLRAMAKYPIESMKNESFLWVPSLTECDPYSLFPLLTSTTLFLMLKFSMEVNLSAEGQMIKIFRYVLPVITFVFTSQMPANLAIYWFINNNITVCLFYLLKLPKIKKFFNLREIETNPELLKKMSNQNFDDSMAKVKRLYDLKEQSELNWKREMNQLHERNRRIKQPEQPEQPEQLNAEELNRKLEELKRMIEEMKKRN